MKPEALLVFLAFVMFGCGSPPPAEGPSSATTSSSQASGASIAQVDAPNAPIGPPRVAFACRLSVTEPVGCNAAQIEALVAPVRPTIEHCRGALGGKLRIRVRSTSGKLAFEVEPGSSLDPTERKCVMDALATIPETTTTSVSRGASVPPTGFSSLLTIEW